MRLQNSPGDCHNRFARCIVTKPCYWDEPCDDVEAMVRAAGGYIRASDDLRPRVLEAARLQHGEQRVQRCSRHLAAFVLLLAVFIATDWQGLDDRRLRPTGAMAAAIDEVLTSAPAVTDRSGDGDWRMIDAFTKLRRQQAQVLRFEI
jgi:hypothetical protein